MSSRPIDPAALFTRYGATVYRRCRRILRNEDDAREAVQEVFLRVIGKAEQFRAESSDLTWIYSIATLHCLQQLRNQRRHQDKLRLFAVFPVPNDTISFDDQIAIANVLDAEPFEVQQIVVLRHVDAMTVEGIAKVVGLSRKTVARRLEEFIGRARQQLGAEEAHP